jgi:hypothetical protein
MCRLFAVVSTILFLGPRLATAAEPAAVELAQAEQYQPPPQQYQPPPQQYQQQPPPQQYQPPPQEYQQPPPGYPPPGYPPPGYPPPGYPPPQYGTYPPGHAEKLINRGHRLKVAGTALMITGAGLMVLGIALVAYGDVNWTNCAFTGNGGYCDGAYAAWAVGVVGLTFGSLSLVGGIPLYIVGKAQMNKGERLRMSGFSAVPLLARNGSVDGGTLSLKFTF